MARLLDESRLVTLTGAPGIGKSRLALEVASGAGGSEDDTALVELAPIGDPGLVPRAIATALSVQEVPGRTLTEAVVAHLRKRRSLLVIDNCEHLVGACAQVVDELLCGCPELRVLATSREPLAITGERVWRVPPLSVPAPGAEPSPDALMDYEGVALFVERARAVAPQFVLSGDTAAAVAEIARRLDGIPLAIELAAARVEMLTPAEIAGRLDDRFALLTKGSRSDLARHQTLQAALDWSHELLSASERALLRRLSVFVGGFCLEGAQAVCAGAEVAGSDDVFDLLARLVSKSLVVSDTANTRGRYRLLETIRAYAAVRLDQSGEATALGEAHARFYLGVAERAEPELTGADQDHWFERLEIEHENLRLALQWSLGHGESEWALRLAGALVIFWRVRCYFSEGRELLEAALRVSESEVEGEAAALRAKALWGVGFMALMAGDSEGALAPLEQSLARFRQLGDRKGCARALLILANRRSGQNDPGMAAQLEESIKLAREAGDSWCLAHALAVAGVDHCARNDLPAARIPLEEAIAVARQARDKQGLRLGLIGLGKVAVRQGDYGLAEPILEEAESVSRELGEDLGRVWAVLDLGELAAGQGDYGRARELLDRAQALLPELIPPGTLVAFSMLRARVALAEGDLDGARQHLEEVHARSRGGVVSALPLIGELALQEGDPNDAHRAFENARETGHRFGDKATAAAALHGLGRLARAAGSNKRAVALHIEAVGLQRDIGDAPGIAASLEALAGLAAAVGRHAHGARLLGAAQALRDANGYARTRRESSRHEEDIALTREGLAAEAFEAAFSQGAALSVDEVIEQVRKGRGPRRRPASGWSSLTGAERQVAGLVAEGLTNREIAERLFITSGTVKNHLSHIFSKLGLRGRGVLAREVRRRQEHSSTPDEH